MPESVGVNTTSCTELPAAGATDGEAKLKIPATVVPFTLATPPESVELDKAWPKKMAEAVGRVEMAIDAGW